MTPSLPGLESAPASQSGAGKGALIGLGVGTVTGVIAAIVLAPSCEENAARCRAVLVGGGAVLGVSIGAAIGALVSDGQSQ